MDKPGRDFFLRGYNLYIDKGPLVNQMVQGLMRVLNHILQRVGVHNLQH